MLYIGIIGILAALDLFIKQAIEQQNESDFPKELEKSGGKILLYKNHNPGFSFGYLKDRPELVSMIPLAVASFIGGMLACLLKQRKDSRKAGLFHCPRRRNQQSVRPSGPSLRSRLFQYSVRQAEKSSL